MRSSASRPRTWFRMLGARFDVETHGRLVQQKQTRLVQEGPRDLHASHLTARELGHAFMRSVRQIDSGERRAGASQRLAAADAVQRGVVDEVLLDRNIDIERSRLKHDAKLAERRCGLASDIMTIDRYSSAPAWRRDG